jgi:polyhydroxyalkanoate synthesis regulator phasin
MNPIKLLKEQFPGKATIIDEFVKMGAINDQTAKVAIVKETMKHIPYRKQDVEQVLADKLCTSVRTIQRYNNE